jgi:hypothetical protein
MGLVVYSSYGGQEYTPVMGVSGIQQLWVLLVYSSYGGHWYTAFMEVSGIQHL